MHNRMDEEDFVFFSEVIVFVCLFVCDFMLRFSGHQFRKLGLVSDDAKSTKVACKKKKGKRSFEISGTNYLQSNRFHLSTKSFKYF